MGFGGYDAFEDPYCYKGATCLRNRFGIRPSTSLAASAASRIRRGAPLSIREGGWSWHPHNERFAGIDRCSTKRAQPVCSCEFAPKVVGLHVRASLAGKVSTALVIGPAAELAPAAWPLGVA